ncbi:uncharacterized protein DS421_3g92590 [Arachis hypogaea]|nr:uncharacterized protein DS421_3g92590 [Arachis hypogaea]
MMTRQKKEFVSKNCVIYAIAVLIIIGVVICFVFTEFDGIIPKQHFDGVSNLKACLDDCRKRFRQNRRKLYDCVHDCYHEYD